jgi:exodeoxyribonuclease-3
MSVSVCSFNVNSIRSRVALIERWLKEKREVDILCFQETKCEADQFPTDVFESMGYHCAVNGQKRLNGVAICSKLPLRDVTTRFGHEDLDRDSRLLQATVGETVILNCYVPRGGLEGSDPYLYKMRFYDALKAYAATLLKNHEKVILLGDFNVALDEIDVYDVEVFEGAVGFLPSERQKLRQLLSVKLNDCFRRAHPNDQAFTWWDYRTAAIWRNEGMRIDYILASEPLCQILESIDVDLWTRRRRTPTPSDHAPLVATFKEL